MRKTFFLLLFALLTAGNALAIPAHPGSARITQPDGSVVTIRLHGDEYLHFNTTDDGYSIALRADGFYAYATLDEQGQLVPTERVAHDAVQRTASERAWLESVGKHLTPRMTEAQTRERQAEQTRQAKARAARRNPQYDYNNFRGLVLLVQFNDREFSRSDYVDIITDMVNKEDYTGYGTTGSARYTGSVRDYFYDNSAGLFSPTFDIAGPVTIDYSQYDAHATQNADKLILAAINAADDEVDFSQYDGDGDGMVDLVYFIFAGIGSNISGNNSNLIWPHRSIIYNPDGGWNWQVKRDGVTLYDYACSTELYGSSRSAIIDGIGVICHEFSHVLGLPDLYDTDYEEHGQSAHPAEWCIMSAGGYLNNGRTPAGYSLYERYATGFATPQLISEEGHITLEPLGTSNTGYRLNTPVNKEFFLIENRQTSTKWDAHLPGHGMLVFRVDSTNAQVWRNNSVNSNTNHNYFELLRAGGASGEYARGSDPFPGTSRVTTLNNTTQPANLLSWSGQACLLGLDNITESGSNVSFDVVDVNVLRSISLAEEMIMSPGLGMKLTPVRDPDYAPYTLAWSSSNEEVATVDSNGFVNPKAIGEVDITVTANDDPNLTATCHVKVEDIMVFDDINAFKEPTNTTTSVLKLSNSLVVYTNGTDAYVRDASGAIVFSNTGLTLKAGDQLNGFVYGNRTERNGMTLFTAAGNMTSEEGYTLTSDNDVVPREVNLADITSADYGDLLTVKAVRMTIDGGAWLIDDDHKIRVFNTFQIKNVNNPKDYTLFYDITGIYQTNTLKGSTIDELSFVSRSPFVEVPTPSGIAPLTTGQADADTPVAIYTSDGRKVADATLGGLRQLTLQKGVYVVKTTDNAWKIAR